MPDTKPPALRTAAQIQADPAIGEGFVIVEDARRAEYEATGYTFTEDLAGAMCLMQRESR